jgi:hypothetical protein
VVTLINYPPSDKGGSFRFNDYPPSNRVVTLINYPPSDKGGSFGFNGYPPSDRGAARKLQNDSVHVTFEVMLGTLPWK